MDGWMTYRLGGSLNLRLRLRAMGSKEFMASSEGPGVDREDDESASSDASVELVRVEACRRGCGWHSAPGCF